MNRNTSCFWNSGTSTDSNSNAIGGGGGDWSPYWDLQEQVAIMWFGNLDQSGGYRSNVKSPEIAGRIQSTMQKLVKLNLEFVARPRRPEVRFFAKVVDLMVNSVFRRNKYRFRLNDAYYNALVHGTAPVKIDFMVRKRKVKMPITKEEWMTKEEKDEFKKNGTIPYREVTKLDQRDVVISNRRLQEIFFDPSARNIHGDLYYADYYFDTQLMPIKRFKKEFEGRTGFKNIDKVKSVGELSKHPLQPDSFFKPPANLSGDYVYLVYGYNYIDDKFIIRANDQFIYEAPLPYMHKKLNIVNLTPFKLPDQLYGIGVVDFLLPAVTQIELLLNAIYDYLMYTTNPILMVEKNIYGDFSNKYRQARPGLMIPVMDVNRAVAPLKYMPLSMDVFQALSSLQRDAVIASQQDPSQLGVVAKNATATANIINKEVMDAYVNFILVNFTEGLNEIASQVFALQHQYLTDKDVYELVNGGDVETVSEYRRIGTGETKYEIDWDNQSILAEETPGQENYLEFRPEMFFYKTEKGDKRPILPEDFDIEIAAESREILSEALEAQRSKENLAQLANYMVDPADKQKVAQHPAPYVDAFGMLEDYFEKNKIPKKYLLKKSEEEKKSREHATEQNKEMFNLVRALPEAGEPDAHVEVHEEFVEMLQKIIMGMESKIKAEQEALMQTVDPQMAMMGVMPQPSAQTVDLLRQSARLKEILALIAEHLSIDTAPAYMRNELMIQQAQQTATPPQAPMPGNSGGGGLFGGLGNMGGSNPGMPNMPQQAGMTQGGAGMLGGLTGQVQQ